MSKIKNRFVPKQLITIHDELLSGLYSLSVRNIRYKLINGEAYLINSIKYDHAEIGLRVKINAKDLPNIVKEGDYLLEYAEDADIDLQQRMSINVLLDANYKYLCFDNMEKFVTNILFDKYLCNNQKFDLTFLEIEHKYRKKASYRAQSLSKKVAERYAKTLDALSKKELFLITDDKFRDPKYGARNKSIYQKFLTIDNMYKYGINNITFSYSFGGFGKIIKQSRRYSTLMPRGYFCVSFNEIRWHLVAFYLTQQIFINLGIRKLKFEIDLDEMIDQTENLKEPSKVNKPITNRLRIKRRLIGKIEGMLKYFPDVIDYKTTYVYDETERFEKKHEHDYDVITGLDNYDFGPKDLDQDVKAIITVVLSQF